MTSHSNPGAVTNQQAKRSVIAALGITEEDVRSARTDGPAPTIANFMLLVIGLLTDAQARNYRKYLRLYAETFDQIRVTAHEALEIQHFLAVVRTQAIASGFKGIYSVEHANRALRWFYEQVRLNKYRPDNPAQAVKLPHRPRSPRRALTQQELADIQFVCEYTGQDPALDRLIYWFQRVLAARRLSVINARIDDIDVS